MSDLTTASESLAIAETDEFADIPIDSKFAPPRPDGSRPHLLYGCMGLGGSWSDPEYTIDDIDIAWAALHAAASIGITELDLADIYSCGKSERIVGEVLSRDRELRAHFSIQTKCGILLPLDGAVTRYNLSRDYISAALDASLARLGVDRVDTLLLHRPDPLMNPASALDAIDEALDEGKIHAWGVSNMGPQLISLFSRAATPPRINQLELSLDARGFVESAMNVPSTSRAGSAYPGGTVEYCMDRGIDVQARSPLAHGRFTAPAGSAIGKNREADDAAVARYIRDLAAIHMTTPETIALWWLTAHPAQIRPVIGTTNSDRILACGDANQLESKLTRDEWYTLLTLARGANCP